MSSSLRRLVRRLSSGLALGALAGALACDETPPGPEKPLPPDSPSPSDAPSPLESSRPSESSESSPTIGVLRSGLDAASGGTVVEFDLSHGLGERAGNIDFFS